MAHLKESALNFGPDGGLVGILTRPSDADGSKRSTPAVVILNAGVLHRVGPNRMHVRLARAIASQGVPCLRIDLPGIGDSRGLNGEGSLLEESIAGIKAGFDVLERHGVADRFIVFGLCSGADHAFVIACVDPRVVGITLVDPTRIPQTWKAHTLRLLGWAVRPEVWYRLVRGRYKVFSGLRRSLAKASGRSGPTPTEERRRVHAELAKLVERGVRICYLITGERRGYIYRRQFLDSFPGIGLEGSTRVEVFPEAGHTFTREEDRLRLEALMVDWVRGFESHTAEAGPSPTVAAGRDGTVESRRPSRSRRKVLIAVFASASSVAAQMPSHRGLSVSSAQAQGVSRPQAVARACRLGGGPSYARGDTFSPPRPEMRCASSSSPSSGKGS